MKIKLTFALTVTLISLLGCTTSRYAQAPRTGKKPASKLTQQDIPQRTTMNITKPKRASHTYRQRLAASPAKVFPLLCPVREAEWAEGWMPELVLSSSGVAERDCVFITQDKSEKTIWYVTRHEPERWFVEMLKILPGVTACRLEIQLSENGDGCFADVTYTHTSMSRAGDEFVAKFTAEAYQKSMQAWETALNHYLTTGRLLTE